MALNPVVRGFLGRRRAAAEKRDFDDLREEMLAEVRDDSAILLQAWCRGILRRKWYLAVQAQRAVRGTVRAG